MFGRRETCELPMLRMTLGKEVNWDPGRGREKKTLGEKGKPHCEERVEQDLLTEIEGMGARAHVNFTGKKVCPAWSWKGEKEESYGPEEEEEGSRDAPRKKRRNE